MNKISFFLFFVSFFFEMPKNKRKSLTVAQKKEICSKKKSSI